jgi:hypothetical protein
MISIWSTLFRWSRSSPNFTELASTLSALYQRIWTKNSASIAQSGGLQSIISSHSQVDQRIELPDDRAYNCQIVGLLREWKSWLSRKSEYEAVRTKNRRGEVWSPRWAWACYVDAYIVNTLPVQNCRVTGLSLSSRYLLSTFRMTYAHCSRHWYNPISTRRGCLKLDAKHGTSLYTEYHRLRDAFPSSKRCLQLRDLIDHLLPVRRSSQCAQVLLQQRFSRSYQHSKQEHQRIATLLLPHPYNRDLPCVIFV